MQLPVTERGNSENFDQLFRMPLSEEDGNQYVIILQDFLTNWPLVFPAPDQKAI